MVEKAPTQSSKPRDKRRGSRRRCRLKVVMNVGLSFTVDVGVGGFCTQCVRVLPPQTPVQGKLYVRGHEVPFSGRVAWAKAGHPQMNLKGRMGVVFTHVASDLRGLLVAPASP